MISSERGINDSTYNKLHLMAEQLGLSDAAFNTAIDRLKEADSEMGLHRYEHQFVQFLSEELEKISGDVLTVEDEARIIDLAKSRYQIDPVRAYQLIHKTANQKNVGMICHLDAQRFALNLVREAAENALLFDPKNRKRLYHACAKWGLSEEEVDHALNHALTKHRLQRRRRVLRVALLLVAGSTLLVMLLWAGRNLGPWTEPVAKTAAVPFHANEPPVDLHLTWWDKRLRKLADQLKSQFPGVAPAIQSLPVTDDRKSIYAGLLDEALASPTGNDRLNEFVARSYLLEPDQPAAEYILDQIAASLTFQRDGVIPTSQKIRQSLVANRLLAAIHAADQVTPIPDRKEKADELIFDSFHVMDIPATTADYETMTVPLLTLNQWNRGSLYCDSNPAKVAAIIPELDQRLASRENLAINEIRTPMLLTILSQQPYQWESLQESIAISIDRADPPKTVSWSRFLLKTNNRPLADFVLERLAQRLKLNAENIDRVQLLEEIRVYCNEYALRRWQPAIVAQERLADEIQRLERQLRAAGVAPSTTDMEDLRQSDLPSLIVEAGRVNNLALTWKMCLRDNADFDRFHTMLEIPRVSSTLENDLSSVQSAPAPTASQIRRLNENFDIIFNSPSHRLTARISALQSLTQSASYFPDIDHTNAEKMATYILADKEPKESLAVERALPSLSHWPRLKLAVLDQFERTDVDLDTLLNILNRLGMQNALMAERGDWRNQMPLEILSDVADHLQRAPELSGTRNWNRLAPLLRDIYQRRADIVNRTSPSAGPPQLPLTLIDAVQELVSEQPLAESTHWSTSLQWLRSSRQTDCEKLVLANQLLAGVLNAGSERGGRLSDYRWAHILQADGYNNGQRLLAVELLLMLVLQDERDRWREQISP